MSSGMYHRRWINVSNDGTPTTVQHSKNVTQVIAPHTYGTSWNSVRWNKSLRSDRCNGCWSRSMSFFEPVSKDYKINSSYSLPPFGRFSSQSVGKKNIEIKNSGPYIREQHSVRFGDTMLSLMNDKTSSRKSPRLPWLSDTLKNRRDRTDSKFGRNSRESAFTANNTRFFQSGERNTVPALPSPSSTSLHNRTLANNTSQAVRSYHGNAVLKADRPWRRRMADATRFRNIHGDETSITVHSALATIRARHDSIPNERSNINNKRDELRSSLNSLRSYIDEQTTNFYRQNSRFSVRESSIFTDKSSFHNSVISVNQHIPTRAFNLTRWKSGRFPGSHSPIRSTLSAYDMKLSKYNSISTDMLLSPLPFPSYSKVNNLYKNVNSHVLSQVIHNSTTSERISGSESNKKRTLCHHSRQRKSALQSDSSSDIEQGIELRKKKLRKRLRKKSSNEGRFESKLLLASEEKGMTVTDDEISAKNGIGKNSLENGKMKLNHILDNLETSFSITFSALYNEKSKLRIIPTEYDEAQSEEGEQKNEKKLNEELSSFLKKKSTEKSDEKAPETNYINSKNEMKNTMLKKKKGNKCTKYDDIPTEMQKIPNIDVKSVDQKEKFCCSDQLPAPFSLLAMDTSTDKLFETTTKHYDDVAHFKHSEEKISKSKSPAPVPGTWNGPDYHEMNISHNKQLQRYEICSNARASGVIIKRYAFCTIPSVTVCATAPKPHHSIEIALSCAFRSLIANNEKVSCSIKYHKSIKMNKKLLATINTAIKFNVSFTSQIQSVENIFYIIRVERKYGMYSITIKEPSIRLITIRDSISKKPDERNSCRAQVTVLISPSTNMNFYQCLKRVQVMHPKRTYPVSAKRILKQVCIVGEKNAALSQRDEFILSDHSLLEKYVKYKREKLKHMHSEPMEFDSRESSCSLAASELMRACAVRILEPTRQVPYITAPNRSRLGSVEVESVSSLTGEASLVNSTGTLDLLSYREQLLSTCYHGLNKSPAIKPERSTSLTKQSFEFDAPMSPFEQKLRNQAFRLHKISTFSDGDSPAIQDTPFVEITMQLPVHNHNRYPSVEGSSLTSNFTAAVAAATQPRHERYAAHIPITPVDGSGRQSATSIDSCNSGTMEITNLQLDQMIDQARYSHYQHRNKFKEAVDYLDQIFEDLKKEGQQVDSIQRSHGIPVAPIHKKKNSNNDTDLVSEIVPPIKMRQHNNSAKREISLVSLKETDSRKTNLVTINRHSIHASKSKVAEKHCLQKKATSFEQTSGDVETSVLPLQNRKLRGERMDFTRRWLTGDIKSWIAVQPKPDLILGGVEEEPDIDEHSLGSCSAEVAAINSVVRKKKKTPDVPDLIQNIASTAKYIRYSNAHQMDLSMPKNGSNQYLQQIDPIKPRAIKAQATSSFPTKSINSLNDFTSFSQSFCNNNVWTSSCDINSNQVPLQRFPSHNRMSEQRCYDYNAISWRSASQDPHHNTLSSVPSEDIHLSTRETGAFAPLQPLSIVTMRGSVISLPDSSNVRPQPLHNVDPIVAIDALVAELELNTDQTSVANKRFSFPTGNESRMHHAANYEKSANNKHVKYSNIKSSTKTKSENSTGRMQQPQKLRDSFNEMTNMLQSVISDVTASKDLPRSRKYVQMAVKNSSMLSMLSPFETINQEKLNPSKVEAMQSIFENKQAQQPKSIWRHSISYGNNDNVLSVANTKEDDNYYEINDIDVARKEFLPAHAKSSRSSREQSSSAVRITSQSKRCIPSASVPLRSEFVPVFPVTHPPPRPSGSTNSSQTGGYYSSGSSLGAQSSYPSPSSHSSIPHSSVNRESVLRKQSIPSHIVSLDEDDGFYDNIQIDEKSCSRGSELDSVSTSSHRILSTNANKLPALTNKSTSNRIGQFLRKISASKPPISAASLISLNKVASEIIPTRPIPLMKSSSMNHYPGKKHTIKNMNDITCPMVEDKRSGLSQRLKNSIFGNKKRLN
ncbi:DNA ligase [Dirofilaria immitis]